MIKDKKSGIIHPFNFILGDSKGVALIKFSSINDSIKFMDSSNGIMHIDEKQVWCDYGTETLEHDDWNCALCNTLNYEWRNICFKCLNPRKIAASLGDVDISLKPTSFLLVQGPNLDDKEVYSMLKPKRVWSVCKKEIHSTLPSHSHLDHKDKSDKTGKDKNENDSNNGKKVLFSFAQYEDTFKAMEAIQRPETCWKINFGRDLLALNKSLGNNSENLSYWDPQYSLFPFPPIENSELKGNEDVDSDTSQINRKDSSSLERKVMIIPPSNGGSDSMDRKLTLSFSIPASKQYKSQVKIWTRSIFDSDIKEDSIKEKNTTVVFTNRFLNQDGKICILCKRKFQDIDSMNLHAKQSKYHQARLEYYQKIIARLELIIPREDLNKLKNYRDRAAERRDLFGTDLPEQQKEINLSSSFTDLFHSNDIGNKDWKEREKETLDGIGAILLKKMGWNEGSGLGLKGTGIKEPLKADGTINCKSGIGSHKRKFTN